MTMMYPGNGIRKSGASSSGACGGSVGLSGAGAYTVFEA